MNTVVDKSKLYDAAKCLTTILVVVGHVTTMYTPNGAIAVAGRSDFLKGLTEYIYAFHMPLFVMLSGCVYGCCLEQQKYSDPVAALCQKGKRLLLPYWFFGLTTVAPVVCLLGLTDLGYLRYVARSILFSRNPRHLWYVLALFWIFVLYISLRRLLVKGDLGLLLAGGVSAAVFVLGRAATPVIQIRAACDYQIFFYLGILFNRYYGRIEFVFRKAYAVGLLLPVVLLGKLFFAPNLLADYGYKIIGSAAVMVLCWVLIWRFPEIMDGMLYGILKKDAFGIYLFHPMIIYVLFRLLGQCPINPIVLSGGISVVALLLSICGTRILRVLHLNWAIGEAAPGEKRVSRAA